MAARRQLLLRWTAGFSQAIRVSELASAFEVQFWVATAESTVLMRHPELVVIVVFTAAVLVVALSDLFGSSSCTVGRARHTVLKLAMAIENFAVDTGRLPHDLNELVGSQAPGWEGPYAKAKEFSDPWGIALVYRVGDPPELRFELSLLGPDRAPGGNGADTDYVLVRTLKLPVHSAGSPPRRHTCPVPWAESSLPTPVKSAPLTPRCPN